MLETTTSSGSVLSFCKKPKLAAIPECASSQLGINIIDDHKERTHSELVGGILAHPSGGSSGARI